MPTTCPNYSPNESPSAARVAVSPNLTVVFSSGFATDRAGWESGLRVGGGRGSR